MCNMSIYHINTCVIQVYIIHMYTCLELHVQYMCIFYTCFTQVEHVYYTCICGTHAMHLYFDTCNTPKHHTCITGVY